ncbi:MAG TPA: DNA repair protein RecN [Flavobacteriaceae bacterium]|nr:DNA repair protein RecN [Flavobacteriaceae bacterium]
MISRLSIKNYALIEDITAVFDTGFTVITGETGAGKSILLDALSLVLGKRADLNSVKNKAVKCVVEAEFLLKGYHLQPVFEALETDYEDHTIIRREILPSGKSRAFINDSPVTLNTLEELSKHLIDIHTQHQTVLVTDGFLYSLLDIPAGNRELLTQYQWGLEKYNQLQKELDKLLEKRGTLTKESDYNSFLLSELEEASLHSGEQELLESEFETLNNVESIQEKLAEIITLSSSEEIGIIHRLREVRQLLNKLKEQSTVFENIFERVQSTLIEYEDIYNEIENFALNIEANPERLEQVGSRLQLIYQLQKKHTVGTINELLEIKRQLEEKVYDAADLETKIENISAAINTQEVELRKMVDELHTRRKNIFAEIKKLTEHGLVQLGMPNARIELELTSKEEFNKNGSDRLRFLFTANKGSVPGELRATASGGEMSRVMLAFKNILSQYTQLPTIIFDEIDTGVSGDIADKMGDILKQMSRKMQVFSITHLPQIAAKGNTHIKVYKEDIDETTQTKITFLSQNDRIIELAKMLGGDKKSESAVAHAKALLN